uniref:Uncharacterized protein n=1 Tax=Tanacetum cinerariifolium TaxID=118510 RepID=A0A699H3E6_TANCI|nr:hypothetical protein [Tanacetum cinerariifolium]
MKDWENNALFSLKIDIDEFSVLKVSYMVKKLGYSDKVTMFYHFKKPGCDLALGEYLILGIRVIEVYVEHHTSTLDTYLKKPNKFPPKKFGKSASARNLLGWNDIRDKLGDLEPLFGLDDITLLVNVDCIVKDKGKAIKVDVCDKGKGIAIDDEIESLNDAKYEEQSSGEEESDGFVDVKNHVEEVEVNMDSFDRTDVDKISYEQNPREFNANDEIEVDMDVMDPHEFKSASDEDGKEFSTVDDVKKDIYKLSIETRRELFLKKNDKVRGIIPAIAELFLAAEHRGQQVPKVNKSAVTTKRGASASFVKASTSGSKVATQKGGNVKTAGNVNGAATGSKATAQKGKKMLQQVKKD